MAQTHHLRSRRVTPLHIELMIHYHSKASPWLYPSSTTEHYTDDLLAWGMIALDTTDGPTSGYRSTEGGGMWVDRLCSIEPPVPRMVETWVFENAKKNTLRDEPSGTTYEAEMAESFGGDLPSGRLDAWRVGGQFKRVIRETPEWSSGGVRLIPKSVSEVGEAMMAEHEGHGGNDVYKAIADHITAGQDLTQEAAANLAVHDALEASSDPVVPSTSRIGQSPRCPDCGMLPNNCSLCRKAKAALPHPALGGSIITWQGVTIGRCTRTLSGRDCACAHSNREAESLKCCVFFRPTHPSWKP